MRLPLLCSLVCVAPSDTGVVHVGAPRGVLNNIEDVALIQSAAKKLSQLVSPETGVCSGIIRSSGRPGGDNSVIKLKTELIGARVVPRYDKMPRPGSNRGPTVPDERVPERPRPQLRIASIGPKVEVAVVLIEENLRSCCRVDPHPAPHCTVCVGAHDTGSIAEVFAG